MLLKKKYAIFFVVLIFFVRPDFVFADLSCCSANGGAYACDYSTNKLYCKDGTVSTECSCHAVDTPTPKLTPTVGPTATPVPVPTLPACPNLASYDSVSKVCKCNAGYLVNDNACVSYAQYCWTNYGGNSVYDKDKNVCSCASGYTWNTTQSSCISFEQFCQNSIGSKSYYISDNNSCVCYQGYAIQNNQCKLIPSQAVPTPQTSSAIITPVSNPTVAAKDITTPIPTKVLPKKMKPTPTSVLKWLKQNEYVAEKKSQPNLFVRVFENIWNFIIHIF